MKHETLKKYKPITNGFRHRVILNYSKLLSGHKPYKPLLEPLKKNIGKNHSGKITVRHKGGGNKIKYRVIDFKRNKFDIEGVVKTIEYDPNRNCFISLIFYVDGEKRYILTPDKLKLNDRIMSSAKADIKIGNCLPLNVIPDGTVIHNIELKPNQGGKIARSAGTFARVLGQDESKRYSLIKLSSGEIRKILSLCKATIGEVSNKNFKLISKGKAGANRWIGVRPTVRGSAMNAEDHPHGGGEGKAPIGRKSPLSYRSKKTLGFKTRKNKKYSNKFIVESRHKSNKRKRK